MIELINENLSNARIVVVGVGGGGGNAVNTMIKAQLAGVDFVAANTDAQALAIGLAPAKMQLGCAMTKGLGAGANPEVGRKAALEQEDLIREELTGADMVFVTAGMGGGTGTGAAPVLARIAKDMGALTVGVVTKPFTFEGKRRLKQAEEGLRELRASCDTLIAIPNQRLIEISGRSTTALEAFQQADDVLLHAVRGISQIITEPGLINVDFADVRTIMAEMGMAMMGAGVGYSDSRAVDAATAAVSSPLLEDISIGGARGILVNITASADFGIHEMNDAVDLIQGQAHDDANIIVGLVHDAELEDEVRITVIATGFGDKVGDRLHGTADKHGETTRGPEGSPFGTSDSSKSRSAGLGAFARRKPERQRPLMDDGPDDDAFDFDAAGSEPDAEPTLEEAENQSGFDFTAVPEADDQDSANVPAYLRRWRRRSSQTR